MQSLGYQFECGKCKRIYCEIVGMDSGNMIKKIMLNEIDGQEAHKILADKFKGIGFEQHTGREPF